MNPETATIAELRAGIAAAIDDATRKALEAVYSRRFRWRIGQ